MTACLDKAATRGLLYCIEDFFIQKGNEYGNEKKIL